MTQNPNLHDTIPDGVDSEPELIDYRELYGRARRYQEVANEIDPQGPFVPMKELLDRELCVISIRFAETRKGPAAFPAFTTAEGEIAHTFTASKVLVPKLRAVAAHLPVLIRVVDKEGGAFGHFYDIE